MLKIVFFFFSLIISHNSLKSDAEMWLNEKKNPSSNHFKKLITIPPTNSRVIRTNIHCIKVLGPS